MKLIDLAALGDVVAFVEHKVGLEHVFSKPNTAESVQQALVIVVSDTASILDLTKHVPNTDPVDSLEEEQEITIKIQVLINIISLYSNSSCLLPQGVYQF